ncbi:MAG: Ig-like domain-containing protein [Micrococcales bacterium]|nr:Ig-like domain-containing protein [Micrococcales bacterium]
MALSARADRAGGGSATIGNWTRTALGVYTATVMATQAGEYTVAVSSAATTPADVPWQTNRTLLFAPDDTDWDKTLNSLETKDGASLNDGKDTGWAKITVQDQYGNTKSGISNVCFVFMYAYGTGATNGPRWVTTGVTSPAVDGPTVVCGTSNGQGVVEVEAVSMWDSGATDGFEVQGRYEDTPGHFIWTDTNPPNQKHYLKFSRVGVDSKYSWFEVTQTEPPSGPVLANGGDEYKVTVYLRDSNNNVVNGGSAQLSLTADPSVTWPTGSQPAASGGTNFTSNTAGVATKTITSTVKGIWAVRVLVGGSEIGLNSPTAQVTSRDIEFVNGPGVVRNSKLTDPGELNWSIANGSDTQKVTAEIRDDYGLNTAGNLVSDQPVFFTIPRDVTAKGVGAGGADVPGPATFPVSTGSYGTALDGVAEVFLVSSTAGDYEVTATIGQGGPQITTGSPATARFRPGPDVSPDTSTLRITTTGEMVAGEQDHCGEIIIRDDSGNVIDNPAHQIMVYVEWRAQNTTGTWRQAGLKTDDGVALICFTDATAGTYDVRGVAASQVISYATGSARQVVFKAGPAVWTNSTLTTSTNPVLATGAAEHFHTATVVVRDQNDNPVPGVPVRLMVTQGSADVDGPWFGAKNANNYIDLVTCPVNPTGAPAWCTQGGIYYPGMVTAEIRSEEPGSFVVTASSAGNRIPDANTSRTIAFTAGEVDPDKSSWTVSRTSTNTEPDRVVAGTDDTWEVAVEVRSAANIKVDGASVQLDLSAAANSPLTVVETNPNMTGAPLAGEWGVFRFHVKSSAPGTFQFPVQVLLTGNVWADIVHPQAMATITFTAGAVDPMRSWLVEPGTSQLVGTDQVVQVRANDSGGYPVENGTAVQFVVPQNVTVRGVGTEADRPGPATVTRLTTGGIATLTVVSSTSSASQDEGFAIRARAAGSTDYIVNVRQASAPTEAGPVVRTNTEARVWWTADVGNAIESSLSITTTGTRIADNIQTHTAQVVVRDTSRNLVSGQKVFFSFNPVGLAASSCVATSNANGVATCNFASTVAGTVFVRAYLGDTGTGPEVSGSPKTAQFVHGDVDPQRTVDSLVTESGAARANGTQSRWARVTVQDKYGNPIQGQSINFHLMWDQAGSGIDNGPLWDNAMSGPSTKAGASSSTGVAQALAYSYFASPDVDLTGYDVKASMVIGNTTYWSDQAKKVAFTDDAPDATKSWWAVARTASNPDATKVVANGSDSYTVIVNLRNIDGNPVYLGSAVITVTPLGPIGAPYTVVSNSGGTGTATIRSTVAGDFKVTVKIGGDSVATPAVGSGLYEATITFAPGPFDQANSRLTAPASPAVANGTETQVIRATLRDAYGVEGAGNLIGGAQVRFAVPANTSAKNCAEAASVSGGGGAVCTVATGSSGANLGVAALTLVSNTAGTYNVTAAVGTTAIQTGSPAPARFVSDVTVDPTRSSLVLDTLGQVMTVGDEQHIARVTIRDASGNLIDRADAQVNVVLKWTLNTDPSYFGTKTVRTDAGLAIINFGEFKAGMYSVSATVATGTINGSPQPAAFKAGAPASAELTGSAGRVLNNGTARHYAEVLVTDQYGNAVSGVTVRMQPSGTGQILYPAAVAPGSTTDVVTSAAGLARVELSDMRAETVLLRATLPNDSAVTPPAAPAQLEFGPDAPDADTSTLAVAKGTATGPGACVVANGTDTWTGTVTLRDSGNLLVPSSGVGITAASQVTVSPAGPYLTNASGQVVVTLTSTSVGTFNVLAQLGTANLSGSPAEVAFCAGSVDGKASYLVSPTVKATANGVNTQVITAFIRDANNNPVAGAQVEFQVPANTTVANTTVTGPAPRVVTANSDGVAELVLVSTKAAVYDVTARVGSTDVETDSPAKATFVAGPVDRSRSKVEVIGPDSKTADDDDGFVVKVTLVDEFDNPVTDEGGREVTLEFTNGDSTETITTTIGDDGTATVRFDTDEAGTWEGKAEFDGEQIGSEVEVEVTHGALSVEDSLFDTSSSLTLADGERSHEVKLILTDSHGNPVPDVEVTIEVSQGSSDVPGPWFGDDKTAKTITLRSCPLVPVATTPAWCTQDGEYIPGLIWADIRSDEPGTFEVKATTGTGETFNGPGDSREIGFTAGAADPSKSNWAVSPNPSDAATKVSANTADSYAVTVTVKSASELLVDGAAVRLNLTGVPELSTVESAPFATGSPQNPVWGDFTFHVKSTKPGTYSFPVQVNVNGTWYNITKPAAQVTLVFVAGDASTSTSTIATNRGFVEANRLDTTARGALDQATLTVTLLDAFGFQLANPDSVVTVSTATTGVMVHDGGVATNNHDGTYTIKVSSEVTGDVVFGFAIDGAAATKTVTVKFVPTPPAPVFDTAMASAGKLSGTALPNHRVEVYATGSDTPLCTATSDAQGKWSCTFEAALEHGTSLYAVAHNLEYLDLTVHRTAEEIANHTFTSVQAPITVKATGPSLKPEPSDGTVINGEGDAGDTITVTDKGGKVLCTAVVDLNGRWSCKLSQKLAEGTMVTITATDPAGNTTDKQWRIGLPAVALVHPTRYVGEQQVASGINFQPGETVEAEMQSNPLKLGSKVADANGKVTWTFTIPQGTDLGTHSIVMTGPDSGTVSAQFQVIDRPAPPAKALPFTGTDVMKLAAVALLALLAGWWLILAARRRRQQDGQAA